MIKVFSRAGVISLGVAPTVALTRFRKKRVLQERLIDTDRSSERRANARLSIA
jgi:hypothetical protein